MVKISIQILVSKKQTPGELYPGESNKTYNHRTVFKNTKCSPLLVEIHIYLCDTVPLKACEKGVKKLPSRLPGSHIIFFIFSGITHVRPLKFSLTKKIQDTKVFF